MSLANLHPLGADLLTTLVFLPTLGALVLLTTLLTVSVLLVSCGQEIEKLKGYLVAFLLLETGMLGSLVALDTILFYVFWEVMLIPMYFILGVWGGKRRS